MVAREKNTGGHVVGILVIPGKPLRMLEAVDRKNVRIANNLFTQGLFILTI